MRELQKVLQDDQQAKMAKIKKEAGKGEIKIENLEEDFDPEEHDRLMKVQLD